MELLMIYKISPHPSLLKRGRKKAEMTHSITRRTFLFKALLLKTTGIPHTVKRPLPNPPVLRSRHPIGYRYTR